MAGAWLTLAGWLGDGAPGRRLRAGGGSAGRVLELPPATPAVGSTTCGWAAGMVCVAWVTAAMGALGAEPVPWFPALEPQPAIASAVIAVAARSPIA